MNFKNLSFAFLLLAIPFGGLCAQKVPEGQKEHYEINLDKLSWDTHTFLVAYGRSGSTWLRYCLEYLTKRPTLRIYSYYQYTTIPKIIPISTTTKRLPFPINNAIPLGVDYGNAPIFKVHHYAWEFPTKKFPKAKKAKLVLLIRNPKEAVLRSVPDINKAVTRLQDTSMCYYSNIDAYDTWNPNRRFLIYYEDLIAQPRNVLAKLLAFLGEPDTHLNSFMENFENHKKASIAYYGMVQNGSQSKGNDPLFHSKKHTKKELKLIDRTIKKAVPHIWKKYLLRYAE